MVQLAEQLELGLNALRRDAHKDDLSGTVRISMSEGFLRPVIERLSELRRAHPALRFEIHSDSRLVDLARREADIGLRIGRSPSPALIERLLGHSRLGLYAATSYIDRRLHTPRLKIADLPRHDVIGWDEPLRGQPPMDWLESRGAKNFVFRSNSAQAIVEATVQGQGIAVLADSAIRGTQGVVRLETDVELPVVPVYIAYLKELRTVPRIRLVVESLIAAGKEGLR
ncbi:MAG: LysR family transcriptional regulator [Deltaproteobacteria bacterium]|nr:LysR family transcriptional regulator [Nannocystaceae bacterium]